MANNFRLTIITPEKTIYDSEAISLVAPGEVGYLGILFNHAPLITNLVPGKLEVTNPSGVKNTMHLDGGFMEVFKNSVTILADSVEK